jgi:hypothetical protein
MSKKDQIYSLSEKKPYFISDLLDVEPLQTANGRYRLQGVTPSGKVVSKFIDRAEYDRRKNKKGKKDGDGLLGNLLGLPDGKIPLLSDIPGLGALL